MGEWLKYDQNHSSNIHLSRRMSFLFKAAPCCWCLLAQARPKPSRTCIPIQSIAKDNGRMFSSLYCVSKYLTPPTMVYFYKRQIRQKRSIADLSGLDLLGPHFPFAVLSPKACTCPCGDEWFPTLQTFSHIRNVASLSLLGRYFHGKCSDELRSLAKECSLITYSTKKQETVESYVQSYPVT